MRNDRVLIPVLHVAHNAKCFSPCVYSFFFSSTTIQQFIFIAFMPTFGLHEYKVEGSGCGFSRKRDLTETDS